MLAATISKIINFKFIILIQKVLFCNCLFLVLAEKSSNVAEHDSRVKVVAPVDFNKNKEEVKKEKELDEVRVVLTPEELFPDYEFENGVVKTAYAKANEDLQAFLKNQARKEQEKFLEEEWQEFEANDLKKILEKEEEFFENLYKELLNEEILAMLVSSRQ